MADSTSRFGWVAFAESLEWPGGHAFGFVIASAPKLLTDKASSPQIGLGLISMECDYQRSIASMIEPCWWSFTVMRGLHLFPGPTNLLRVDPRF